MSEHPEFGPFSGVSPYPMGEPSAEYQPHAGKKSTQSGEWLKLSDAAQTLGVSEITIRRRVKAGRIESTFRGGRYYVFVPPGVTAADFLDTVSAHSHHERADQEPDFGMGAGVSARFGQHGHASNPSTRVQAVMESDLNRPDYDHAISSLRAELRQKDLEIESLRRQLADQMTLNAALESALGDETIGGLE